MLRVGYAVLDVETTGLCRDGGSPASGHAITEIAVVTLDIFGEPIRAWHSLVNPGDCEITPKASQKSGLRDADVADAPKMSELAGQLWPLLAGRLLVAHNAAFDCAFLDQHLPNPAGPWVRQSLCTLRLARRRFPDLGRHRLENCANWLFVPHIAAAAHRALGDVLSCTGVFRRFLATDSWPPTWDDQLRAAAQQPSPDPAISTTSAAAQPRPIPGITDEHGELAVFRLCRLTQLGPAPIRVPHEVPVAAKPRPAPRRPDDPTNAGASWTPELEAQLRAEWLAADPAADAAELISTLAEHYGRSHGSIFSRLLTLLCDAERPGATCTPARAGELRAARYNSRR